MPSLPLSTPALIAYPTPLLGTVKNMNELYELAPLDLREGFLRVPVSGSRDPYKVVGFADRLGYSEKTTSSSMPRFSPLYRQIYSYIKIGGIRDWYSLYLVATLMVLLRPVLSSLAIVADADVYSTAAIFGRADSQVSIPAGQLRKAWTILLPNSEFCAMLTKWTCMCALCYLHWEVSYVHIDSFTHFVDFFESQIERKSQQNAIVSSDSHELMVMVHFFCKYFYDYLVEK